MLHGKETEHNLQQLDYDIRHLHKLQIKKRQMDRNVEEIKKTVFINLENN